MVSRTLAFVAFFSVFILVYFGMNSYVFFRLAGLLGIKRSWIFYLVLVTLTLSFPLMNILTRYSNNNVIRIFYISSAVWLGALVFLFFTTLLFEIVNLAVKIPSRSAGFAILGLVFVLVLYSIINALPLSVRHIEIPIPNLEKEVTMVHISDLHLGAVQGSSYLKKVVDKTNAQNPDIVVITGDLVDGSADLEEIDSSPLNNLKAKTFMSIGNHDQYEGIDRVTAFLDKTQVQLLRNELVNYQGLQIIGIDNPYEMQNNSPKIDPLDSIKINKSKPSVLLFHLPNNLKKAQEAGINLQLSGHTHNGQIIPINFFSQIFFPKVKGLYEYHGMHLNVLTGTGTWGPPFRLGSKNEIAVIKLVKQ